MASYDKYIERRDGYSGGYPILKRLHVSVRIIVEMSRQVANFEQLCQELPQCTPEEIRAALEYYEDNRELIEQDIERNQEAWQRAVTGT